MVTASRLIRQFVGNDLRLVRRDSFLIMMAAMALAMGLIFRFLLPWADVYLAETGFLPNQSTSLRLADLFPMLVSFIGLFQGAVLVGTIFGFLFLDEKDGNTLKAMLVTPVPLQHYLAYRAGMPMLVAFLVIFSMLLLIGHSDIGYWRLTAIAACASPAASLIVLYYALVAGNKVQGFALAKFVAIAGWIMPIAWFLPEPWQWLAALFPPYLVHKAFWMAEQGAPLWWGPLLIGFAWQIVALAVMARMFRAKMVAERRVSGKIAHERG